MKLKILIKITTNYWELPVYLLRLNITKFISIKSKNMLLSVISYLTFNKF